MRIDRVVRGAISIAAILLSGGCAAASVNPTPTHLASQAVSEAPTLETDGGRLTSPRFGWSVVVPAGWLYRQATEDWPPGTNPAPGARYTDNIEHASGFPTLDVSTRLLSAGQSPGDFLEELDRFNQSIGCEVEADEEGTVDGEVARVQRQSCAAGTETVWEVIAFDGDRVYAIYWLSRVTEVEADEALFRETLGSFRFAPE
jgi:hypothetical protein